MQSPNIVALSDDGLLRIVGDEITCIKAALSARERVTRQQSISAVQALTGKDCGNWNRAIVYAVEAITSLQKESNGKESQ